MKTRHQVHQSEVSLGTLLAAGLKESKDSQTEIDCHDDDIAVGSQLGAIVGISWVPVVRFAMDEHHRGQFGLRFAGGIIGVT